MSYFKIYKVLTSSFVTEFFLFYFFEVQSIVDAANVSFTIPSLFILLEVTQCEVGIHHSFVYFMCLLYIHVYANHI